MIITAYDSKKKFQKLKGSQGRPVLLIFKLKDDEYQDFPKMIYKKFLNDY